MEQQFLVLRDAEGTFLPMAFISPDDESGKIRAGLYQNKMDEGDEIVVVIMKVVATYA